uniref:Uncharacterized protein n=1 Tax=Ciona intestinalis TaxID=7719 RepID=F6U6S5_CIOIN
MILTQLILKKTLLWLGYNLGLLGCLCFQYFKFCFNLLF